MIETVCICGAGTMGAGIAQVAAQSGMHVLLHDVDEKRLLPAIERIEKNWLAQAERGKITTEQAEQWQRMIRLTSRLDDCRADLILEAIVEDLPSKLDLLNALCEINGENSLYATNTSSLSVTAIGSAMQFPHRMAGMHFFNPAPQMRLVEIIRTKYATEDLIGQLVAIAKKFDKVPVLCEDSPGFIVNHVARPYYLEALRLVEEGIADIETVDRLMEASGFKMGPFRLMDLIGNDINYTVSRSVYEALGRPLRLKPSPLQEQKLNEGAFGKKSGKGYYTYTSDTGRK
jgi:3-hydroxybutyryl-CoA dehydrogenase